MFGVWVGKLLKRKDRDLRRVTMRPYSRFWIIRIENNRGIVEIVDTHCSPMIVETIVDTH